MSDNEYKVTVNVVEYGRTMFIRAASKADAIRRVKAGEWPEEGTGDPTHYRTTIINVELSESSAKPTPKP